MSEPVTLQQLQHQYDELVARRRVVSVRYDLSEDGSTQKIRAIEDLDRLGDMIRNIEDRMNALIDENPE